jgi:hypothetical protein
LQLEPGQWQVRDVSLNPNSVVNLQAPEGAEVLGVSQARPGLSEPALIVLDPGRKTLRLEGLSGSSVLSHSPSEITAVTVGRRTGRIAYTTAAGELIVYSLEHDTVLLRVVQEAAK